MLGNESQLALGFSGLFRLQTPHPFDHNIILFAFAVCRERYTPCAHQQVLVIRASARQPERKTRLSWRRPCSASTEVQPQHTQHRRGQPCSPCAQLLLQMAGIPQDPQPRSVSCQPTQECLSCRSSFSGGLLPCPSPFSTPSALPCFFKANKPARLNMKNPLLSNKKDLSHSTSLWDGQLPSVRAFLGNICVYPSRCIRRTLSAHSSGLP